MPHALYILHDVWQKSGKEWSPRPEGFERLLHCECDCVALEVIQYRDQECSGSMESLARSSLEF